MENNKPANTKICCMAKKALYHHQLFCMAEQLVAAQVDSYFCFSSMQVALGRGKFALCKQITQHAGKNKYINQPGLQP